MPFNPPGSHSAGGLVLAGSNLCSPLLTTPTDSEIQPWFQHIVTAVLYETSRALLSPQIRAYLVTVQNALLEGRL